MTDLPSDRTLGKAFVTALVAELGAGKAAYGKPPAGSGQVGRSFTSYAVVYPGGGIPGPGTAAAPNADALQIVQVTYVGRDADQADALRDQGRAALLHGGTGPALAVEGRSLGPVLLEQNLAAREDTTVEPHSWYAIDLYRVDTTPA